MTRSGTSLALKKDLGVEDTKAQRVAVWRDPRPSTQVRIFF